MKQTAGAIEGDNNGFVNIPLSARDVLAVVYTREVGDGEYRVSLRSKGDINVVRVAETFGGGGHKNAAGCCVLGDWDAKERELVAAVTEAVIIPPTLNRRRRRRLELTSAPEIHSAFETAAALPFVWSAADTFLISNESRFKALQMAARRLS